MGDFVYLIDYLDFSQGDTLHLSMVTVFLLPFLCRWQQSVLIVLESVPQTVDIGEGGGGEGATGEATCPAWGDT